VTESRDDVLKNIESEGFGVIQGGYNLNLGKQTFTNKIGITHPYIKENSFFPCFTFYTNGSEIIVEGKESEEVTEFLRLPLTEKIIHKELKEEFIKYFMKGVTSKEW